MSSLFITGTSGFMGQSLLRALDRSAYDHVYCLDTRKPAGDASADTRRLTFIEGDLSDGRRYESALRGVDTVVHLAAVTGKAPRETYFEVNTKGTQVLLQRCQQADVKNFLFVSSIAVRFPNRAGYDYAESKERAEQAVRSSGLRYAIVRPTIVIGQGSGSWRGLAALARLPIIPIFGDGTTKLQPIYVQDLVECLKLILASAPFSNEVIELGGPEAVSLEAFLTAAASLGGKKRRVVHLPLNPLRALLARLEKPFGRLLPLNAGQLSAFGNDGTIETNRFFEHLKPHMKNVDEMLRLVVDHA